jgi:outer membrane protein
MYTVRDNPVEVGAGPFRFAMTEQSNGQYELAAREVLWDGGRRGLAVTAAQQRQEAVQAAGDVDVQQTQLAALHAYLSVLELTGSRKVLEQRLLSLRAHFDIARDLYDQGLVARNDLLETEVSVREVEDAAEAIQHAQAIALQNLNRLLGREPEAAATLPDSLPEPPALPADREALLAAAADHNAALKAASFRLDAEKTAARLARKAWLPNLTMTLSHAWQENEALVHPYVNSVMAGVSWSIFDGGARKADVRRADAQLTAAMRTHLEARRKVSIALDGAWRDHAQARREEMTARENVAAARENLRIVEDQYRAGVARSSDVLDAETLLAESRYQVVTKHYARYFAQARLLTAAGCDLVGFYGDR